MKGGRRKRELSIQRSRRVSFKPLGFQGRSPAFLASPPWLLAGSGNARRVSPSACSLERGGHWGDAPGPAWRHLGLPGGSFINRQDPELSSSLPHGTCNFSRNRCASFSRVIIWFLLAEIPKPLLSVKVQLAGPGDADLSCDLGWASPEAPSWSWMVQDWRWDRYPRQPYSFSPRGCFFNAEDSFGGGSSNLLCGDGAGQEPQPPSLAITTTPAHAASLRTSRCAWGDHAAGDAHEQPTSGPAFKIKTSTNFSRA